MDLNNVRLACKGLADVGAEIFLAQAHLIFEVKSLERLKKISLHPLFSQHVKPIIYEAGRLDHYNERKD